MEWPRDCEFILQRAADEIKDAAILASDEAARPFMQLKTSIMKDGNQWSVLYGENLMEGVSGYGDSPEEASRDFDRNWLAKISDQVVEREE